jgi:RES domain-containing protein
MHDPDLLDRLEGYDPQPFEGQAWRITFDGQPVVRPNTRGARWNPPSLAALYTSTTVECVRAEFQHVIALQSPPPTRSATEYTLDVRLSRVLDLSRRDRLRELGLDLDGLDDDSLDSFPPFQNIGDAAAFLGVEGLLVPSMRYPGGTNLVIFVNNVGTVGVSEISETGRQTFQPRPGMTS